MADLKMVSMERTKAEKKAAEKLYASPSADVPEYPYGLCLSLGKEEMAKLGIDGLPEVGEELHLYAICKVTRVSSSASIRDTDEDSKGVDLQITEMALVDNDADEASEGGAAATMYGKPAK